MTLIDELEERLQNVGVRRRGVKQDAEAVEQRSHASDRPRVEQRQQELGVVGLETIEVVQLANLMADDDAEVPERIEEAAQELLFIGADAAAEQNEQIDVRLQAEMPPAIATERQDRDLRVGRGDVGEELPQHRIDAIGIALERGPATRTAQAHPPRARIGRRRTPSREWTRRGPAV